MNKQKPSSEMKISPVNVLGMDLIRWQYESCTGDFGIGDNWATLYTIESGEENKGHATELLKAAKEFYEGEGKKFGGSVALSEKMRKLYIKLGIKEYK